MPAKRLVKQHGLDRWEVDFGVDVTGKKKRQYFETENEADGSIDKYEKELKSHGEYWARLKPLERQQIVTTLQDMEAAGKSVDTVWADWKRWREDNQQMFTTPMPYDDAVTEWKRRKKAAGKTERYTYHAGEDLM